MRRFLLLFGFCTLLAGSAFADGGAGRLNIRIEGGGWGQVPSAQIEKTLYAVAGVLLPHLSATPTAPIVVTHASGPPVTLYERGPNGEYRVQLHASGPRWPLYVYEFAHELTHIVSNYDLNAGPDQTRRNQWLEESLCETASLFVLDRLADEWIHSSVDYFAGQAGALRLFFDSLVGEPHRRLPAGTGLAAWLADNEASMRGDPYQRQREDLVAKHLLALFRRDPGGWDTVRYLNLDPGDNEATLAQYLGHWYGNAPAPQKPFVGGVLNALVGGPGY